MPVSRQPFEPVGSGGSRLIRTVAGLIVTLGLLGAAAAWLLITPVTGGFTIPVGTAPVLYLSATSGNLLAEDAEENRVIRLGENLEPGALYKTTDNGVALLRSSAQELSFLVASGSTVAAGGTFDPAPITLVGGSMTARSMGQEGGNGVILNLSGASAQMSATCIAQFERNGDMLRVNVLDGIITLDLGDETNRISAGESGTLRKGAFQLTSGPYLPAPVPYRPAAGTLFRRSSDQDFTIELQWSQVPEAERYRVELSDDVLFRRIIAQRTTDNTRLALADVYQGRYYWRVTSTKDRNSGAPSRPIAFTVQETFGTDDESVSSPELDLIEVTAQSNLVSIRGQTEPGAHIVVYLELYGQVLTEPREVLVSPSGAFRAQLDAPQRGELVVVVQSYYRPEIVTHKSSTVFVDF